MPNGKVNVWCTNKPAELARAKAIIQARWPKNPVEFYNPAYYDGPPDGKRFAQQVVAVVVLCVHPPELIADHRREGFDVVDMRFPDQEPVDVCSESVVLVWMEQDQGVQERLRTLAREQFPDAGIATLPASSWPTDKSQEHEGPQLKGVVCADPRWRIAQDYRSRGYTVATLDVNAGGTQVPQEIKASMGDTADPGVLDALLTLDEESFVSVVGTQSSEGFLKALAAREEAAANRMVFQAAIQARLADMGSANPVYADHLRELDAQQAARAKEKRNVEAESSAGNVEEQGSEAGQVSGEADQDAPREPERVVRAEDEEAKLKSLSFQQAATVLGVARKLPREQVCTLLAQEKAGQQRLTVLRGLQQILAKK